jgi:DNA processing protein
MDGVERRVVAALWALQGVGVKALAEVRSRFGDLADLYERPVSAWTALVPFTPQARASLARVECLAEVADRLDDELGRLGYRVIFPEDPAWPPALRTVPNAPPLLFMQGPGAAGPPRRRVAVVGTRNPETGSTEEVRLLVQDIAALGVGIVSGAAEGIDRVAHLGALDAGGETWAFLACAIEEMDPAQAVLREVFAAGEGTFFSQFPPGTRPDKGTFVQRNAWISGSAEAVVVARAPKKSGALITAENAVVQGRPVLVMPGDPWNAAAVGSNALLRKGARPCLSAEDVLAALGLEGSVSPRPPPPRAPRAPLSPSAQRALAALTDVSTPFDELIDRLAPMDVGEATAALLELELAGHAVQKAGKCYEKVS